MSNVHVETTINAPIERCFDLSRSVDLHIISATGTDERAIAGVTTGLMGPGDIVTWEARHFGWMFHMTVRISGFDRPRFFTDSMVSGPFKRFDHTHRFESRGPSTVMIDDFVFECPLWPLGRLAAPIVAAHLRSFLTARNEVIKRCAESDEWKRIL